MNVTTILSYGSVGLGFYFAFFSFRLLRGEQIRKEPSKQMLDAIYV